jgi:hypothetical protein
MLDDRIEKSAKVFFLKIEDGVYVEKEYIEHVETVEYVWRIFLDKQHSRHYGEAISHYEDRVDISIAEREFGEIIKVAEKEGPKMFRQDAAILRVDLSIMEEDSHPETVSTVYRFSTPNYLN